MKKILLIIAAVTFSFAAQAQTNLAQLISGAYEGQLYISLYTEVNEETEYIDFSKIDLSTGTTEGNCNFALYNFGFSGMNLGNIELTELGISQEGNKFLFAEKAPIEVNFVEAGIYATAAINAEQSYIKGDSAVVYVDVVWVDAECPIYVLFKGRKITPAQDIATGVSGSLSVDGVEVNANQKITFSESALGVCSYDMTFEGLTIAEKELGDFTFAATAMGYIDANFIIGNPTLITTDDGEWTITLKSAACSWAENVLTLEIEVRDASDMLLHSVKFVGTSSTPISGIEGVEAATPAAKGIYSLSGAYVGTSLENLPAGLYIVDGVKTLVK